MRRPFLVLPAWFNDQTVAAGLRYYADHGFEPAGHHRYDPGRKWRDLPPAELVGHGLGFEQEIEPLYAQIKAACPAADALGESPAAAQARKPPSRTRTWSWPKYRSVHQARAAIVESPSS